MENKSKKIGSDAHVDSEMPTDIQKDSIHFDVNADLIFKNESLIKNGEYKPGNTTYDYSVVKRRYLDNNEELEWRKDAKPENLTVSQLKNYKNQGHNSENCYEYLKSYILNNKDNQELLQNTVSSILGDLQDSYDSEVTHKDIGASQTEVLDKILNTETGEELSGLICTTIHEFLMKTLNDCGINAVLLCGTNDGSNHTTLLYQRSDGKYVFNNYSEATVIDAANIKDAIREVYKSGKLESCGYITIIDENHSYQEFAMKDEAAFGNEMDKRDYNSETPFDFDINKKSSINGSVEISSVGNVTADAGVQIVKNEEMNPREAALSLQYKNTNESSIFHNSQSIGLKSEYKGINKKNDDSEVFFETKGIVSYTEGTARGLVASYNEQTKQQIQKEVDEQFAQGMKNPENYHIQEGMTPDEIERMKDLYKTFLGIEYVPRPEDLAGRKYVEVETKGKVKLPLKMTELNQKYVSAFFKGALGKKTNLIQTDKTEITNIGKATLEGGFSIAAKTDDIHDAGGIFGDARLVLEDGIGMNNTVGKFTLNNIINTGLVADLGLTSGEQKPKIQPGIKLNAASSVKYDLSDNFEIMAGVNAHAVITQPAKDSGISGGVAAEYRPAGTDVTIFGNSNVSIVRQNLSVGGFNQLTENNKKFSVSVGAKLNEKTALSVGYTKESDALNKTRNNSSVMVGVKINL